MATLEVLRRIDELILDDGYTEYAKVPDDLQNELVALSIRDLGKHAYEVLVECNDVDGCISDLIGYLINGTPEAAERLAETMRDNSRLYFETSLTDLFEMRFSELDAERKREGGLHPIVDRINGEIRWIR